LNTNGNTRTLTAWSYSVYTQYIKCPFSIFLEKIARIKVVEKLNEHTERGGRVHLIAEVNVASSKPVTAVADLAGNDRVKAYMAERKLTGKAQAQELKAVSEAYKELTKDARVVAKLADLRKHKASPEGEIAFDRAYNRVDWRDWSRAWLRVKCDAIKAALKPKPVVEIIDWKTGKQYDDHRQQRSLYGMAGLQLVKLGHLNGGNLATQVIAQHIYTDTGLTATEEYDMNDLAPLKKEWEARTAGMLKDTKFRAAPGPLACRFCKFGKSKGGPCDKEKL
jgi:RecB family exonuclease